MLTYQSVLLCQTVQFFIQDMAGALYITVFKYSLRNLNVITRR